MQAPPEQPSAPADADRAAPATPAESAGVSGAAVAPAETSSRLSRSKAALASGYLGLIPFVWAFFIFPYAYSGFPKWMKWRGPIITTVLTLLVGITPALITAILGHRTIRRNPGCEGKGHAVFAYVACAMVFVVLVVAMVRKSFGLAGY